MKSSGRVEFLENVRKALNRKDPGERSLEDIIQMEPDADDSRVLEEIAVRDTNAHIALVARLIEAGKRVNVDVLVQKDAVSAASSISEIAAAKSA